MLYKSHFPLPSQLLISSFKMVFNMFFSVIIEKETFMGLKLESLTDQIARSRRVAFHSSPLTITLPFHFLISS